MALREEGIREGYSDLSLREMLAMLLHCTYYRDLDSSNSLIKPIAYGATFLLRYDDERALRYGKLFWKPLEWKDHIPSESELKKLRVAFFIPNDKTPQPAPKLVIALRGTLLYMINDIKDDIRISEELLADSNRVKRCQTLIVEVIDYFLTECGGSVADICLTGHSLGAGIALVVGKHLAASGKKINTHLFAPPLVPQTSIISGEVFPKNWNIRKKRKTEVSHVGLVAGHSGVGPLANAYVEMTGKGAIQKEFKDFEKLGDWIVSFYVNRDDLISCMYIEYYENQMPVPATPANVHISEQAIWTRLFGGHAKYISNVVPSANLYISTKYPHNLKAHSLRQWHRFTDEAIGLTVEEFRLFPPIILIVSRPAFAISRPHEKRFGRGSDPVNSALIHLNYM